MHALGSGLSGSEYARQIGKPQPTMAARINAAAVAQKVNRYQLTELSYYWQALNAIHPAPAWLWPALVAHGLRGSRAPFVLTCLSRCVVPFGSLLTCLIQTSLFFVPGTWLQSPTPPVMLESAHLRHQHGATDQPGRGWFI